MRPMPTIPSRLPDSLRPSIQVGVQPWKPPAWVMLAPSTMRREAAMIRPMVRSAVSSVSTPGVLVTMIPRALAAATSMWSKPTPKLAISFSCGPAFSIRAAGRRSVMVQARTSARCMAATRASGPIWVSSMFSSASNSSRIRVSTGSGSLRVTTTFGLRMAMGGMEKGASSQVI